MNMASDGVTMIYNPLNLYSSELSNYLAKVAMIVAPILSIISIVCSVIIDFISNT